MKPRTGFVADVFISGIFVAFISIPGILLLFDDGQPGGNLENRKLAEMPKGATLLKDPMQYATRYEAFFNDRFGLRQALLQVFKRTKLALGVSPHKDAILGKDGWLFSNPERVIDQLRGASPLSERHLHELVTAFEELNRWLAEQSIPFLLVLAPEKHSIYPEYLPSWTHTVGRSRTDQLVEALAETDVPFLDLRPVLSAAKSGPLPVYYKTDSHWNCLGAFAAYEATMDRLEALPSLVFERVAPSDLSVSLATHNIGLDIARHLIGLPEYFEEPNFTRCRMGTALPLAVTRMDDGTSFDREQAVYYANYHWKVQRHGSRVPTRLLLVRDSYGNALVRYLNQSFAEVHYVHNHQLRFDGRMLDRIRPDILIFELIERILYARPKFDLPALTP